MFNQNEVVQEIYLLARDRCQEEILVLFANFGTRCHFNMHRATHLSNKNTMMLVFFFVYYNMHAFQKIGREEERLFVLFLDFVKLQAITLQRFFNLIVPHEQYFQWVHNRKFSSMLVIGNIQTWAMGIKHHEHAKITCIFP